jgi:hypothetical protein
MASDGLMDASIACRWDKATQGYIGAYPSSARARVQKTTLCLGSGRTWDPAEAARVAAHEAREEAEWRARRHAGSPSHGSPAEHQQARARGKRNKSPSVRESASGWLSERARTNQRDRRPLPRPSRPPPLQGPWDSRTAKNTGGAGDKQAPARLKSRNGSSSSGWHWDADYSDKDPVDPRPIVGVRINGGLMSPARWDPKTHGYIGTNRMRVHWTDTEAHACGDYRPKSERL